MGMYDDVKFEMTCPLCHSLVFDFQSKNKDCQLELLEVLEVENFYANCDNCDLWINFTVEKKAKNNEIYYLILPTNFDMQAVNKDLLEKWTAPEWRRKRDQEYVKRDLRKFNRRYTDKIRLARNKPRTNL